MYPPFENSTTRIAILTTLPRELAQGPPPGGTPERNGMDDLPPTPPQQSYANKRGTCDNTYLGNAAARWRALNASGQSRIGHQNSNKIIGQSRERATRLHWASPGCNKNNPKNKFNLSSSNISQRQHGRAQQSRRGLHATNTTEAWQLPRI